MHAPGSHETPERRHRRRPTTRSRSHTERGIGIRRAPEGQVIQPHVDRESQALPDLLQDRSRDFRRPGGSPSQLVLLLVALGAAVRPVAALAQQQERVLRGEDLPVVGRTLDNGMRFLVLPRHASPTVTFLIRYGVGGVNEVLGSTGTAHLLEHMLFKGSTTVGTRDVEGERALFARMDAVQDTILDLKAAPEGPDTARVRELEERIAALEDMARELIVPNELDQLYSRNGARGLNATTGSEATTYFVQLPANRVKLWFVLEADRMRNPVFREFYTERDVVMEERRTRVETSPGGLLYEAHMAAAFPMHPYGVPVVGYMSDLENLTRRQVEDYYRRYYGPSNAIVAIVGDVDPDSVVAWADAYFGPIPPGDTPPAVLAREPEQRGERRVEVVYDAEPQLRVGWPVVSELHPDRAPLTMLATILTGGRTTRLYRRLVLQDRLAASVSASVQPGSLHPGLFVIEAVPLAPHAPAEVEKAIYQELERLAATPPEERELQRVRNQLEASRVRRLQSNFGLALQLAESEALWGSWQETFRQAERLAAVTPEDIQRVAREYFRRDRRTVAVLVKPNGPALGSP